MSTATQSVLNIAAYKFVALENLHAWREQLLARLSDLRLKGTILLSPEGINMFLAGEESSVRQFVDYMRSFPEFTDLATKDSYSDRQPFNRTLVRLKKEIIAFGVDGIDPIGRPSPKMPAEELKRWLDEGRDVTLLDVRNDYEVELGSFRDALPIGVDNFRDFPAAVERLPEDLKDRPIVMFCTGGIRCEKAGPFMEQQGFQKIFQLDGGILKYFESVGGQHYDGDCFVFDQRVSLNPDLDETDTDLCYVCQQTLSIEDQASEHYVPGVSCPHCYRPDEERITERAANRTTEIARFVRPLPGSHPQDNERPITVSEKCVGMRLIDLLDRAHPHVGRDVWSERCATGRLKLRNQPVSAEHIVSIGERFQHITPDEVEPDINATISVLYEDDWMVAVNKPAPLPMHPSGRFNRNTLTSILNQVYGQPLRIAHRLDANTTGVVILSRSKAVARQLQPQFEQGQVEKTYLARIQGHPTEDEFRCEASISASPTQAGLRTIDADGLTAQTEFTVQQRFDDGTSLLAVRPLTGRTNQIRIHLWSMEYPILGDPSYLPGGSLGQSQTLDLSADPMCLHAWRIGFVPYHSTEPITLQAPAPSWAT